MLTGLIPLHFDDCLAKEGESENLRFRPRNPIAPYSLIRNVNSSEKIFVYPLCAYSILDLLSIVILRPLYPTHSVDKEARACEAF